MGVELKREELPEGDYMATRYLKRVGPSNYRLTFGKLYAFDGRRITDDEGGSMKPSYGNSGYWLELYIDESPIIHQGDIIYAKDDRGRTITQDIVSGNHNIKEEQQEMSNANIEMRVYIQGKLGNDLSDKEIFQVIKELEKELGYLESLNVDSDKVNEAIVGINGDIHELVKYVDNR